MITALDHFVLVCPDIESAVSEYTALLGYAPNWRASADGAATAVFAVGNTAIELVGPNGKGGAADRLREITANGAVLTSLVYRSDDIGGDLHLSKRRGLDPSEIRNGASTDMKTGSQRAWQRYRIPDARMAGVKTFVLQHKDGELPQRELVSGAVTELDHLVVNTPNPERTVATYGGRLGLHLALDRTAEQWNTRFLFFRLGGLTLEIINRLDDKSDPSGPDSIWGLTWATDDLEAAHQRLREAGVVVSDIRTGRKPGSRVFTVKSSTQDVPTLFIHHAQS
jgi:catechol 2,3-dioxygenase-like lactoylglutathione lyase family enzyme